MNIELKSLETSYSAMAYQAIKTLFSCSAYVQGFNELHMHPLLLLWILDKTMKMSKSKHGEVIVQSAITDKRNYLQGP